MENSAFLGVGWVGFTYVAVTSLVVADAGVPPELVDSEGAYNHDEL